MSRFCSILIAILFVSVTLFRPAQTSEVGGQIENLSQFPADTMRSASMTWVKLQLFSSDSSGQGVAFVHAAHAAGMKALASVESDRSAPMVEATQVAYVNYLIQLASAGIDGLELWNEPNYRLEFNGTASDYAHLYRRAYTALKARFPGVLIISAALMPTGVNNADVTSESRWAAELGTLPADCTGVHYEDWPFTSLATRLIQIRKLYGSRPICFTEFGVLSPEGYGESPASFAWAAHTTAAQQAQVLHDMIHQLQGTARLIIVWNVGFTRYDEADPQAGYSIIRPGNVCLYCATGNW